MNDTSGDRSPPTTNGRWNALGLVAVVLLFAAGTFQFATLKYRSWPKEERVNNGSAPTFFAFHICPSYNFSEDFHLYYVRAKRIAQRGWTDSLLYSRPDEKSNYSAPLQVLHGWLALTTEGSPRRYSIFMFATVAFGWTVLVLSARRWLPSDISSASILVAVLVTVLFEALEFTVREPKFNSFGVWPMFRALRMSTMSWTNPVLLSVMIGIVSLIFNREKWKSTLFWIAVMLVALLCTDNWAFGITWTASVLVMFWLAVAALAGKLRQGEWPKSLLSICACMTFLIAASYWVHEQLNSALAGDGMVRGGVGMVWQNAVLRTGTVVSLYEWLVRSAVVPVLAVLAFTTAARYQAKSIPVLVASKRSTPWNMLTVLALLPIVAILVLNIAMSARGMEKFLLNQFYWRVDYCLLFAVALAVAEWLRTSLPVFASQKRYAWTAVASIALIALFGYHNYRIHWFVNNVAARDFFLTADAQGLKPWLERFDREHDRYELATASLELNYLSAFWTDADLLLPSGFPYHNSATNAEIEARTVGLMRLYHASEESWLEFTKPARRRFQDIWLESRIDASGEGYMYHLFHRWAYFKPEGGSQKNLELIRRRMGASLCPTDGLVSIPSPEIILVDPVSRSLGQPDLSNYVLAHQSGSIEAWVRKDVSFSTL